jgi:hypothetical protein
VNIDMWEAGVKGTCAQASSKTTDSAERLSIAGVRLAAPSP